jgi:hypothetical protein
MPDPDFRALCAELLDWAERTSSHYYKQADVIVRARAALAQPEPVAPTDEDLEDLAEVMNVSGNPVPAMRRALELWGNSQRILDSSPQPEPVAVTERLPEPEDCDRKGRCWIFDPGDHVSGPVWAFEGSEEFQ